MNSPNASSATLPVNAVTLFTNKIAPGCILLMTERIGREQRD
jgi:hypothetical protein